MPGSRQAFLYKYLVKLSEHTRQKMPKKSFKDYLSDDDSSPTLKSKSKSIEYLEDLDVNDFIDTIENLSKKVISEKLDGTAFTFGFDNENKFYTTRAGKGSQDKMRYKAADWGVSAAANGFKAAHIAIKKHQDVISHYVKAGMACDVEILFGRQPNTIIYGLDETNYIAFIKITSGTKKDLKIDQSIIKKLANECKDLKSSVKTIMVDTSDGVSLSEGSTLTNWKFTTPDFVDAKHLHDDDIQLEIRRLKKFLESDNKEASRVTGESITNSQVLAQSLTKIKATSREEFKELKEKVSNRVMNGFKLPIKDKLLNKFVRKIKPKLQSKAVKSEEEQGLEGIVVLDPTTQRQVKIVDKDAFSTMNKFNYMVRNDIRGMVRNDKEEATLDEKGGLFGSAKIRIARLFQIDGLAQAYKTKKILAKFKGDTAEETVSNFAKSLESLDWHGIKTKVEAILSSTLDDIQAALDNFKENKDTYRIKVGKKEIGYTDEVSRRTLLVFAETRKSLMDIKSQVSKAGDMEDIVIACFGKQIKDMNGESHDIEEY